MSRIGINYDHVKQAAIQLLTQGEAPSVQKVREILGTGSHTTIASHLKIWRDDHAQKSIRHLPATLPTEIIGGMEVLWQTAMEKASLHLAAQKDAIEKEREQLLHNKREAERFVVEIKEQLTTTTAKLEELQVEYQQQKIDLALALERLESQGIEFSDKSTQYKAKLQHTYVEKEMIIEKNGVLEKEIVSIQEKIDLQIKQTQDALAAEYARYEQSENRWSKLIDTTRQENKNLQKRLEKLEQESTGEVKNLNQKILGLQQGLFEKETLLRENLLTQERLKQEIMALKANKPIQRQKNIKTVQDK